MELKPKTEHQLIVKLRDQVAARIIGQKASKRYWQIIASEAEKDTQERIDALQKVSVNEQLISADKKYLQVIDEMLEVTMARATGGTITTYGNYTVHTFTSSGTFTPDSTLSEVDVLVVAGGGAGGPCGNQAGGGGGGAGEWKETLAFSVTPSTGVTVTIGAGGTGTNDNSPTSNKGKDSSFGSITCEGGGRGGGWTTEANITSQTGGSGGGAGYGNTYTASASNAVSPGFGYAGGAGISSGYYPGGGGGGAGAAGGSASTNTGGNGGIGKQSSLSGSAVYYAAGGGGGCYNSTAGTGGTGGGGNGGTNGSGSNATANTGSGGGGAGYYYDGTPSSIKGGDGGSGIVIVRYPNIDPATVTTSTPAGSITSNSATGGGNVTDDGGATVTERGIVWGTSANPTTAGNKQSTTGTTGAFGPLNMTGLTPDTHYYYRAYAINSAGTSYGADVEFDTLDAVISGTCTLAGSPVAGAIITLIDSDTDAVVATDTSDVSGNYSFNGLDVTKTYHVVAEYEDSPDMYNAKSLPFMTPEEV